MSRTTDPSDFFQPTSVLEDSARKSAKSTNKKGEPIRLPSKILAIVADPRNEDFIYVAEAAGTVKRVSLETREVNATFVGPIAPVTSLALSPKGDKIYAGCWDKTVWCWDISKGRKATQKLSGHTDFVKAVTAVQVHGKELVISGSADASIIVWDAETGSKLHTLKGHTRGVLALAVDPLEYDPSRKDVIVFSAGSDREIRRWRVGVETAAEIEGTEEIPSPLIVHETSIDSIRFDADGDLWTASAEKSSKCLSREQNFSADTTLAHPDFVRDVAFDEVGGWVVTACRDEDVRVWEKGSGKLHHSFAGHYEEVTGLVFLEGKKVVVSVSIDGTIRQWSLGREELAKAVREAEEEKQGVEKKDEVEKKGAPGDAIGVMTAEEEAELAELMSDSEEE